MAKLESLIVDLQLNTAELKKGLDTANKQIASFNAKLLALAGWKGMKDVATAIAGVTAAAAEFVMAGADAADMMGKQATFAGDSVENFSAMAYAMRVAGISSDDYSKAMLHLGKNLTAASAGGKEQVALFAALGVSATDSSGKVRASSEVLLELADTFAGLEDGAAKSQLAVELFGKGGQFMADSLSKGSTELRRLTVEAAGFGAVVSGEAAAAAGEFGDNVDRVKAILDAVAMTVANEAIPAFNAMFREIFASREAMEGLRTVAHAAGLTLKGLGVAGLFVATSFEPLLEAVKNLSLAILNYLSMDWIGAAKRASAAIDSIKVAAAKGSRKILELAMTAPPTITVPKASAEGMLRTQKSIVAGVDAQKKAVAELTRVYDGLREKVASFGETEFDSLTRRVTDGDLADSLAAAGDKADELRGSILGAAAALESLSVAKFEADLKFQVEMQIRDVDAALSTPKQRAGESNRSFAQRRTTGYADGAEALKSYRESMAAAAEASANAARAARAGNDEAAREYTRVEAAARDSADAAANASQAFAEIDADMRESAMRIGRTVADFATSFASKLGDLGNVIQAGIQGAQAGGWWGAIIAIVIELFSMFERFGEIISYGNRQLLMVMDLLSSALNGLADAFLDLMRFSGTITRIVMQLLGPALRIVGHILGNVFKLLTPIFNTISTLMDTLAPIVDALMTVAEAIDPFQFAIQAVSIAFNVVSLIILGIMRGLYGVWGNILNAVKTVMDFLLMDTREIAKTIAAHNAETAKLDQQIERVAKNLADPFAASVEPPEEPLEDLGDAAGGAAEALAEFTHSLTNVPTGFRYAAAAFGATGVGSAGDVFGGGGGDVNITVEGSLLTDGQLVTLFEQVKRRLAFRRGGAGGSTLENIR